MLCHNNDDYNHDYHDNLLDEINCGAECENPELDNKIDFDI